jgi:hypothetical protein
MMKALFVTLGVAIGFMAACGLMASPHFFSPAEAQAGPGPGNGAGTPVIIVATGGATPNQNDLCWVFRQEKGKTAGGQEYDRTSLSLYKAGNNGSSFDLIDTRETTWDGKPVQLNLGTHNKSLAPKELKNAWEKEQREERERADRESRRNP